MSVVDVRALVAEIAADPVALAELRRVLGVDRSTAELISIATYAAEHDLHERTVYQAAWSGRLPSEMAGRRRLVRRDAVIAPKSRTKRDARRDSIEQRLGLVAGARSRP